MLKEAYEQAYALLKENEALMDKLAEHLIQKETITGKEFMEIFNQEKGILPEADTAKVSEDAADGKEPEAEAPQDAEGPEESTEPEQHGPWNF